MTELLTHKDIANRFEEAVYTLKRLPKHRVQGFFNAWPAIAYTDWEIMAQEVKPMRLGPPLPDAIDRMDETFTWINWIEDVDNRHMVWLRAKRIPWKPICYRLGIDRNTAWKRHKKALQMIADRVNKQIA